MWRSDLTGGGFWKRRTDEWDIDAGVLPAATFEGNAVLSAAADAEVRGAGTEGRAARRAREGKLCLGQRGVGVWQRFATKWATSPQIVDSMQLFRGDSFCESLQIRHSGATNGVW